MCIFFSLFFRGAFSTLPKIAFFLFFLICTLHFCLLKDVLLTHSFSTFILDLFLFIAFSSCTPFTSYLFFHPQLKISCLPEAEFTNVQVSGHNLESTEGVFLDKIQTEILRVFLLAIIHRHLN